MAEKYRLRQPEPEVDLALGHWLFEKRDLRGRWTAAADVAGARLGRDPLLRRPKKKFQKEFEEVEATRGTPAHPGLGLRLTSKHTHIEARVLSKGEIRKSLTLSSSSRTLLFKSAGLNMQYHEDSSELIQKWHEVKNPKERAKIEHEMIARQKCLSTFFSTLKECDTLAKHSSRRQYMTKFDEHLKTTKVGRALLHVRDKMVTDEALDKFDAAKEKTKEFGEDTLKHFATSRLVQVLISMAAGFGVHLLGNTQASEAIRAFMENPALEAGIGAAISIGLGIVAKSLRKGTKVAAEQAAPKATRVRHKVAISAQVRGGSL